MTTRDEIIALAEHNGIYYRATPLGTSEMFCFDSSLEAFYHAAQRQAYERAAKCCDARYMGDNNREDMEAKRCAEAIRSMKV